MDACSYRPVYVRLLTNFLRRRVVLGQPKKRRYSDPVTPAVFYSPFITPLPASLITYHASSRREVFRSRVGGDRVAKTPLGVFIQRRGADYE